MARLPETADDGREFRGGLILGAERDDPIELAEYDPIWPARYAEMRDRLANALGASALRIEHVGSTAVPGLAAKPIVDIQVSVADVEDEAAYRSAIESCGFGLRYRKSHWRYFRPGVERLWQIHVCSASSEWERVHLLFRGYLRSHPRSAAAYAGLKWRLAEEHRGDRIAYTDAKTPFIEATLHEAKAWAQRTGWRP